MAGSIRASACADVRRRRPRRRLRLRLPGVLATPGRAVGAALLALAVATAMLADVLAPYDPLAAVGPALAPPSAQHPMGTDDLGRDVLSGVIFGARTSLAIALGVGGLVLALGIAVGASGGYVGGLADHALTRVTEMVQTLPRFFLAIVVLAFFGAGTERLILVLGLTSWPLLARVIRAEVLSLRERDFVASAEAMGGGAWHVLRRHLVPNALPPAVAYLALLVGQVILLEASLSFLGLGDPNAISWGAMAGQAQRFLRVAWWLSLFPGLAILATVLGLNLVAEGAGERS